VIHLSDIDRCSLGYQVFNFGRDIFSWSHLGYSFVFMCVVLSIGIVVFNKIQRSFMDTV